MGVLGTSFFAAFTGAAVTGEYANYAQYQVQAITEGVVNCKWAPQAEAAAITCDDASIRVSDVTYVEQLKIDELEERAHRMSLYSAAIGAASLLPWVGFMRSVALFGNRRNGKR